MSQMNHSIQVILASANKMNGIKCGLARDCIIVTKMPEGGGTRGSIQAKRSVQMLWTIFVILLILWILGFSFHIAGGLIHLLLVIAVVVLIIQLITGRRVV